LRWLAGVVIVVSLFRSSTTKGNGYPVDRWLNLLPDWAHPRFPLVANELRQYNTLDYRIIGFRNQTRTATSIINILLFIILGLLLITGGRALFGYLLFPFVVIIGPLLILLGEMLLVRTILGIPAQTGRMIAGEITRGTWETILSTPLPRHHLVLSKLAAQFWNAEIVLTPIIITRLLVIGFVTLEGLAFETIPLTWRSIAVFGAAGIAVALAPALEIFAFNSIGLLNSLRASSLWNATMATWIAVGLYRALVGTTFALWFVDPAANWLLVLFMLIVFPHWLQVLIWVLLLIDGSLASFAPLFGVLYVVVPILVGTLSAWLAIWLLQSRRL
jgi:hypothetical protein